MILKIASESVEILHVSLPIIGDCTLDNNFVNLTESEVPLNDFEFITDFEVLQQNLEVQETGASEFNTQEDINCVEACS